MDNRIFNVNGEGSEMLRKALQLAFMQEGRRTTCQAWAQSEDHGLVLMWCKGKGHNDLPCEMTAEQIVPMVEQWLDGEFAKRVTPGKWCDNRDHDGDNSIGWQVYCEEWGHVGASHYAICGIRPAYLWHGK